MDPAGWALHQNSKMTRNSQLVITTPKTKTKRKTKQTTRTGTESQKWRSHGGLSVREWDRERRGKVVELATLHTWEV